MNQILRSTRDQRHWNQRYTDGVLPWDSGIPDAHLNKVIGDYEIAPCNAVEIGCGTGTNVIHLTHRGFEVTGVDLAPTAIEMARGKLANAGVTARLFVADYLKDKILGSPFGFAYDRGCFHSFDTDGERLQFSQKTASLLSENGIWHSLIGSTDGPPRDTGPPRRSASSIVVAVEPYFEILELTSTSFDQGPHHHARAWVLVARKRG